MRLEDYAEYFQVRHDFIVQPLGEGSSKRQVLIPRQRDIDLFAHTRSFPEPANIVSEGPVSSEAVSATDERADLVECDAVYGGILFEHFGHFVAESVHRLWLLKLLTGQDVRVVFHVGIRHGTFRTALPSFAVDILESLNVDSSALLLLDRPLRFSRLYVPTQARFLGRAPVIPDYSEKFFGYHPGSFGRRLYVSRSNYLSQGSYFGERLVERTLAAHGFEVIYPETLAPSHLVRAVRDASEIVFAEGSAIHLLEICGRIDARVLVVMRRSNKFRAIFEPVLQGAVSDYDFFQPTHIADSLDWDISVDRPLSNSASSFVDLSALFRKVLGPHADLPSKDEMLHAVRSDVLRYICSPESTSPRVPDSNLGAQLRKLRATLSRIPGILD
jgi:hypothetical protein